MVARVVAIGCSGLLLAGCVMSEKYEAEKARGLNFQRLLAQEEKRTGELDAELKRVKGEKSELEARNREMTAQIQAVREQLASIQEEAAAARENEAMRAKGGPKKKAKPKPKPEAMAAAPAAEPAPSPAPAAEGAPSVHVVQAGETVFRIARQYGVSVQQIRNWNNLKNDVIEVGQQLVVAQP
jgi:LysM repeat protein